MFRAVRLFCWSSILHYDIVCRFRAFVLSICLHIWSCIWFDCCWLLLIVVVAVCVIFLLQENMHPVTMLKMTMFRAVTVPGSSPFVHIKTVEVHGKWVSKGRLKFSRTYHNITKRHNIRYPFDRKVLLVDVGSAFVCVVRRHTFSLLRNSNSKRNNKPSNSRTNGYKKNCTQNKGRGKVNLTLPPTLYPVPTPLLCRRITGTCKYSRIKSKIAQPQARFLWGQARKKKVGTGFGTHRQRNVS